LLRLAGLTRGRALLVVRLGCIKSGRQFVVPLSDPL